MDYFVNEFSKPSKRVVSLLSCMFVIAKACLKAYWLRHFPDREDDADCFVRTTKGISGTFTR